MVIPYYKIIFCLLQRTTTFSEGRTSAHVWEAVVHEVRFKPNLEIFVSMVGDWRLLLLLGPSLPRQLSQPGNVKWEKPRPPHMCLCFPGLFDRSIRCRTVLLCFLATLVWKSNLVVIWGEDGLFFLGGLNGGLEFLAFRFQITNKNKIQAQLRLSSCRSVQPDSLVCRACFLSEDFSIPRPSGAWARAKLWPDWQGLSRLINCIRKVEFWQQDQIDYYGFLCASWSRIGWSELRTTWFCLVHRTPLPVLPAWMSLAAQTDASGAQSAWPWCWLRYGPSRCPRGRRGRPSPTSFACCPLEASSGAETLATGPRETEKERAREGMERERKRDNECSQVVFQLCQSGCMRLAWDMWYSNM